MEDTQKTDEDASGDRASSLYIESLGVSLSDLRIRADAVDDRHQESFTKIAALAQQTRCLLRSLRKLRLRRGKLPT